jgi:hypothetical protein
MDVACACLSACVRGLPSLANGAGLFLTVCVRRSAKLRMSQDNTIHARALLQPCSLGIRGFKSHPPHCIYSNLTHCIEKRKKERNTKHKVLEHSQNIIYLLDPRKFQKKRNQAQQMKYQKTISINS